MGHGAVVAADAVVDGSVVMDGARIGAAAVVRDSIVGANAHVGAGPVLERAVVGDRAVIGERNEFIDHRVWTDVAIPDGAVRVTVE